MKLNKIASAIAIIGFGLSSAAWSQIVINAADPATTGITVTNTTPLVPATNVVGVTYTYGTNTATDNGVLANPATTYQAGTVDATNPFGTISRTEIKNGVSQTTTNFSTPNVALGDSSAPKQGTLGGPGGVSGLGAIAAATTTNYFSATTDTKYVASTTATQTLPLITGVVYSTKVGGTGLSADITVAADSVAGGVAYQSGSTIAKGTVLQANDHIVTQNVLKKGTVYAAGSVFAGAVATGGTTTDIINLAANDKVIVVPTAANTLKSTIGTGIKDTDHDFATKVTSGNTGSVGLCTYCHTPHKASSTLLLWNKTMSQKDFKWDVAATTAGTALPGFSGSTYSGPSAKCLACHDGSVAIGDIGWFAGQGRTGTAAMNTKTMYDVSDRFVMGGATGQLGAGATYEKALSTAAAFGGSAVHPVAIPYPLNGAPNVYNGSVTGARLATADFVADPTANNIRLYSDVGGGQIVGKVTPGKTGIECSSCHDVHNKAATDKYFLRGKMVGSSLADGYICAQCHTK